ncbi:hypothetical protein J6590_063257 [Homalodisca vitripennis]|nr:hypothetical protein J6590_063257 [Homalodisca vitripennis]
MPFAMISVFGTQCSLSLVPVRATHQGGLLRQSHAKESGGVNRFRKCVAGCITLPDYYNLDRNSPEMLIVSGEPAAPRELWVPMGETNTHKCERDGAHAGGGRFFCPADPCVSPSSGVRSGCSPDQLLGPFRILNPFGNRFIGSVRSARSYCTCSGTVCKRPLKYA